VRGHCAKLVQVFYLDFLSRLHERLEPRTYLEIGVRQGHSLALSRCRSIGVDPAFSVDQELLGPVSLVRATSDEYFASLLANSAKPFGELPVDFAFIDGMHLCEFALRDFANVERYSSPWGVIAFDDVFPRNVDEAARDRHTEAWTGDVFRVLLVLEDHRPDLRLVRVDTEPTGLLLVSGLSPASSMSGLDIEELSRSYTREDPQEVPDRIICRHEALQPNEALALPLWDELRSCRAGEVPLGPRPEPALGRRLARATRRLIGGDDRSGPPASAPPGGSPHRT
jgi:hypothetical protein